MSKVEPRTLSGFMELLPARQAQFDRIAAILRVARDQEADLPVLSGLAYRAYGKRKPQPMPGPYQAPYPPQGQPPYPPYPPQGQPFQQQPPYQPPQAGGQQNGPQNGGPGQS